MGQGFRPELHDVLAAGSLLTRVPLPVDHTRAGGRASAAVWAYPVVGAGIGAVAGALVWGLGAMGLPPVMAAVAGLAAMVWITGALHEDGLADSADGLGSGATGTRLREIMKDSRIGAFGVVALILAFGFRSSGAVETAHAPITAFCLVGAVSRLPMALVMCAMPLASDKGLAARVGRPPAAAGVLALGLGCVVAFGLAGIAGLPVLVLAFVIPIPLWMRAQQRLGGHTGDILGATQQLSEVGVWLALVLFLTGV